MAYELDRGGTYLTESVFGHLHVVLPHVRLLKNMTDKIKPTNKCPINIIRKCVLQSLSAI